MALNIKYKKTSLDENASIYSKRDEDEPERSKWSKMDRRQKWVHFKAYYLRYVVIGCFVLALAGFFLYKDVIRKTEVIYRSAVLNEIAMELPMTEFADGFTESMNIDPDRNLSSFHLYYTDADLARQIGAAISSDLTQVSSMIYAGTLDSFIAGQSDFDGYREKGFFADLSELLSAEQMKQIEDKLYIPENAVDGKRYACGVYLDESQAYQQIFTDGGGIVEKPILGILFNSKNKEVSKQLLYYLFPELRVEG